MKIAIGSGKGGTGKTTVAVALALAATESVQYLDCDVEEPNGHIFLKPAMKDKWPVSLPVPCVDSTLCDGCGTCDRVCQFNAIISLAKTVMVFPELCHGCGGCSLACPTGALSEIDYEIGCVEKGMAESIEFVQGCLTVGHAMSPPVIRAVKREADDQRLTVIDCPPGTSCPFIAGVKGSDAVILVTEPTPFGLHDLTLAVETVRQLGIRFGVIVNRVHDPNNNITAYCEAQGIGVLMQISERRSVAVAYSRGDSLFSAAPELKPQFQRVLEQAVCMAKGELA
ncbi:MAG: 4Fe-4S binding protein [Phycisphaeraceae bacterium]|nr:4Fe-4S binding protein [Phycisphaeraceae bacterium]